MRLGALLPRALVIVFAWVLATAAFTFAADRSNIIGPSPAASTTPAQTPELTVPAVDGQAFVFAKGILEDAGFAWRVSGPVHGYAANTVLAQSPAAGTKVVDTGAPTVTLRLVRGSYAEQGAPEDTSSYMGTSIKLPGLASVPVTPKPAKQPAKAAKPKPAKPAKPKPAEPAKPAKPAKPHAKPKKPAKPSKPAKPVKHANKPAASRSRPPAFTVPGAPKEPLDEITLPARADRLAAWIATKPKLTNANASRWLYQHSWIVTGAKFGWWHGDRALVKLIAVDRSVERIWGLGHRSEAVARAALAQVRRAER
jgi:outer membrane biosynthesis protein TonB